MSYVLGIDVGTTRTSAAVTSGGARDIEVVELGDRSSSVPSVLLLGDDGSVVVGEAADRRAVTDAAHVVREFKRRIGDPTPIVAGGRAWAPEELSARLARWVVDQVAQRHGGPASRVAVTHPASWGRHKLDLFGSALAQQGLSVMFLAEPQAAALHYAATERVEAGSTIAVYDLGGGTFDAAVVHKDATGTFSLLGRPEGLERLGGVDFDDIVFEHVRAGLPEAFEGLDEDDPAVRTALAAVRRECTEAKEALSSDTEVTVPVLLPGAQGSVRLHRSEFEAMIRPQLEETVTALRRAIASAGCTPEQLSAVLLVGGSSRIPLVAELVSQELGRPVAVDTDPKHAIAKGAALALTPTATPAPPVPLPRSDSGMRPGVAPSPPTVPTGTFTGRPGIGPMAPQRAAAAPLPPRPPVEYEAPFPGGGSSAFGARAYAGDPYEGGDNGYAAPARDDRSRSPALLVSAGGAIAAVAVIAAAFLLPHAGAAVTPAGLPAAQVPAASASPTPEPTSAPPTPVRTRRPEPVKPPVVTTTPAPTTAPATTEPTTPPSTKPTTPSSAPGTPTPKPTDTEDPKARGLASGG